ncbi:hypothetical protein GCM10011496_33170 [Polaromonas eurypsychrophila]|uniref:Uncharacterized protein n=1 Tax=Polaromonas eurypsychrophila TaxID=1614635 RepID=A0A916WLL4_9BURK|nr:hypothetical protein GCM10011496_33170 [Polaromonas eurypsychrophila]
MKQKDLGLGLSTRRTRKQNLLEEMDQVLPWSELLAPITPHAPVAKVRYSGLAKNTAQLIKLFVLSNIWMARSRLLRRAKA